MKHLDIGDDSCLGSMIDENTFDSTLFFSTEIGRYFKKHPLSLIDVGARWGVNEMFLPLSKITSVMAFEPDKEEANKIIANAKSKGSWASLEVKPTALGNKTGKANLHVLKRPNNSSLYPVDPMCAKRYELDGFQEVKKISVPIQKLDDIAEDFYETSKNAHFADIVKLDTQGSEFDIILGGQKTLGDNTACLICEVPFFSPYANVRTFGEIEKKLTSLGFSFYGFIDFKSRSTKRLDKKQSHGRERVMQADAVFFKDLLTVNCNAVTQPNRQSKVTYLSAFLLGYFDYCLEILDHWKIPDKDKLILTNSIKYESQKGLTETLIDLDELTEAVKSDPKRAMVRIGKFVDDRRDRFSYHDVY